MKGRVAKFPPNSQAPHLQIILKYPVHLRVYNALRRPKHKGNIRNGRCKRHGGASTGPMNQTFGKDHHRYIHGMRTKEVIAMRRVVAEMKKSLGDLVELI